MTKIFKYKLEITDIQTVEMPEGSVILCIQTQNEEPHIWALVNPNNMFKKDRTFLIYGTGHTVSTEPNVKYIGTFQLQIGSFVGHCFEVL